MRTKSAAAVAFFSLFLFAVSDLQAQGKGKGKGKGPPPNAGQGKGKGNGGPPPGKGPGNNNGKGGGPPPGKGPGNNNGKGAGGPSTPPSLPEGPKVGKGPSAPGRPPAPRPRTVWTPKFNEARTVGAKQGHLILLYIRDPNDNDLPPVFEIKEVEEASATGFLFVQVDFDKDHPLIKSLRVRKPPLIVILDPYAHEVMRSPVQLSRAQALSALTRAKSNAGRRARLLASKLKKAMSQSKKTRRSKQVEVWANLGASPYGDYPEVKTAREEILKLGAEDLTAARKLDPAGCEKALRQMLKQYKSFEPADRARLELAGLIFKQDRVREAFRRIDEVERLPEEAADLRKRFIGSGRERILAALKEGMAGEEDHARTDLDRIQALFEGTEIDDLVRQVREDLER